MQRSQDGAGERLDFGVSTHSRPKAAAASDVGGAGMLGVSTHSRPKAADSAGLSVSDLYGFNTQPPEGGCEGLAFFGAHFEVSTPSRPKAADRLGKQRKLVHKVSTHSRPKAAGLEKDEWLITQKGFNTQPPEGG